MDKGINLLVEEQLNKWTKGWVDRQIERWMDGQMSGKKERMLDNNVVQSHYI